MYEQKQPVPSLHQTSVQTQQTLEIFENGAELSLIQASMYHAHMKIVRTRAEDIFLDIIKSPKNSDFLVKQTFFLFLWNLTKASSSFFIFCFMFLTLSLMIFSFCKQEFHLRHIRLFASCLGECKKFLILCFTYSLKSFFSSSPTIIIFIKYYYFLV